MIFFCCDKRRRQALRDSPHNGIDFLEVLDHDAPAGSPRQRTLLVRCFRIIPAFTNDNVRIDGGERITPVKPLVAFRASTLPAGLSSAEQIYFASLSEPDHVLVVRTDSAGDFSTYRLSLVKSGTDSSPPDGFDPLFSVVGFSFKVECPSDFDCAPRHVCPPASPTAPEIDYLAKDYASFRRLVLDRMSLLMPQWRERNPADLGIALVELLAYVGDYLSYQQDAVATEAYLGTARRRVSVRRHARLVDYFMHDGCNARVWVQVQLNASAPATGVLLPEGTKLFTRVDLPDRRIPPTSPMLDQALRQRPVVFETMRAKQLFLSHNELHFYTWGDRDCCLPQGATRATLRGHLRNLKAGEALIFLEIRGPKTGAPADADPARRHVVRLTHVALAEDLLGGRFEEPPNNTVTPVTEIQWSGEDALPFPLCVSSLPAGNHDVSVALGNIVPADHGETIPGPEELGAVPKSTLFRTPSLASDRCTPPPPDPVPPRFRPFLQQQPLTFAVPWVETLLFSLEFKLQYQTDLDSKIFPGDLKDRFDAQRISFLGLVSIQGSGVEWSISDGRRACVVRAESTKLNVYDLPAPARFWTREAPDEAVPSITLESVLGTDHKHWQPKRDLLDGAADAAEFVVETEREGTAFLRFGDQRHGSRPEAKTVFTAEYRIGNGVAGNIGTDALRHVVTNEPSIEAVRNPLPARGGVEVESLEQVRQRAPAAFNTQERAVTEADYAEVTQRDQRVQRAAATFRWTGSWHTVFVTVDRLRGLPVDEAFETETRRRLERFRMAGHDLEIDGPRSVPLEIEMHVCVRPDYFRSEVKAALIEVFSNRALPDGRRGVFHPDNFTFGQPIFLSPLYAAAQAVPGVASVRVTTFQRPGRPETSALDSGQLELDRLEIARLDNDPNFPERGIFRLDLGGGK